MNYFSTIPLETKPGQLSSQALEYLANSLSSNTKRAYWLALQKLETSGYTLPITPMQLVEFLTTVKTSQHTTPAMTTLQQWLSGIAKAHELMGYENPCQSILVKECFKGMRRTYLTPSHQAQPLLQTDIASMVTSQSTAVMNTIKTIRDRALILVGFTGMFRTSELVSIQLADLLEHEDGIVVWVRRSKTDQVGYGRPVGIPRACKQSEICPVKVLKAWLAVLKQQDIIQGPVLRNVDRRNGKGGIIGTALTTRSVNRILKHHAQQAGIDPTLISGHSLRAGAVTTLARAGVDLWKIQQQGGWKDIRLLVERYIRNARLFADNAMANIW